MADNVVIDFGVGGDKIAADDISGVKYVRVKPITGADGVNDGDVESTNPMPTVYRAATTDTVTAKIATDAIQNGATALTVKYKPFNISASGANEVVAAVASKKIRVLAMTYESQDSAQYKWTDGSLGTDLSGLLESNVTATNVHFCPIGWFETTAGNGLFITQSGATNIHGQVVYVEV